MENIFSAFTVLIVLCAAFAFINERYIKLPGTIGVAIVALITSVIILIVGKSFNDLTETISLLVNSIDFSDILLDVMLAFLLFASALHFDYKDLKEQRLTILAFATIGVLLSTFIFGTLLFYIAQLMSFDLPYIYCLIFGALISPTDPIAVGAILKNTPIPKRLNIIISGESLFNDAVGLILFVTLLGVASHPEDALNFTNIGLLFAQEVGGGIIVGLIVGYVGVKLIQKITDLQTILLISIAAVLMLSVIAKSIHASVPIAAVIAGLLIGNENLVKNNDAHDFLGRIWKLNDEVLNTILFVLIGLQLVAMEYLTDYWLMGVICIPILLLARYLSVSLPAIGIFRRMNFGGWFILTWAGLRGGISVAMALTLPASAYREPIIAMCYVVVVFSIIGQGLTLGKAVNYSMKYIKE